MSVGIADHTFLLRPKCYRIFSLPFAYATGAHYGTPYSVVPIDAALNGKLIIQSLSIYPVINLVYSYNAPYSVTLIRIRTYVHERSNIAPTRRNISTKYP